MAIHGISLGMQMDAVEVKSSLNESVLGRKALAIQTMESGAA